MRAASHIMIALTQKRVTKSVYIESQSGPRYRMQQKKKTLNEEQELTQREDYTQIKGN